MFPNAGEKIGEIGGDGGDKGDVSPSRAKNARFLGAGLETSLLCPLSPPTILRNENIPSIPSDQVAPISIGCRGRCPER
jgi:hypothetical protein